jgi:phosphatidylserine decarboxylase
MASLTPPPICLPPAESPQGVQPGGVGFFGRCELAWGRLRRAFLRRLRPGHVEHWRKLRQGDCDGCQHDVIDPRDLKYVCNVCGYWFRPEDDVYAYRERLGFARYGFAELVGFSALLWGLALAFGWLANVVAAQPAQWAFIGLAFVALVVWLEVVWFFRDPRRSIPADADALLSPADGTVTHVETVDEAGFPGGKALRVSIFLSIFNVHVNRVPRAGRVKRVQYYRGAYLDARHPECATRNEQLWIDFADSATGRLMRVKQISGAIARRIVCRLKPGDEVQAGERYGMIKFGSRTDVLIPILMAREVIVQVGDKVKGGTTILIRVREQA